MARRKTSLLDEIATLPWPAGVILGVIAFVFLRTFANGAFAPLAWVCLLASCAAAAVSFFRSLERKQLLDTQTDLDSLARMSWREFEMLVGEAFRRRGYFVEETGLGGKDGGIDLIVSKGGRTELVQCKQWRTRQVRAATVREMWGLVDHHRADGVNIVCIGDFTADAAAFAEGKAIELINGEQLLELVRHLQQSVDHATARTPLKDRIEPQVAAEPQTANPSCPSCGAAMTVRRNRQTGQAFWGCLEFPGCHGTRPAAGDQD